MENISEFRKFSKENRDKEPGFYVKGVRWTPSIIKHKIETSDDAVKHALLRIYSFQTDSERQSEETTEANGKGFNGVDAEILTSFAKQLETRKFLSPKQITFARKKLVKYTMQLFGFIVEPLVTAINTDPKTGKPKTGLNGKVSVKDIYDLLRYTDYQEKLITLAHEGNFEMEQIKDFLTPELQQKIKGTITAKKYGL